MAWVAMTSTRDNRVISCRAISNGLWARTQWTTHPSSNRWKRLPIWSTRNTFAKRFSKTAEKATWSESIQVEVARCTIHSSSIQGPTTKWSKRCSSPMRSSKTMVNWQYSRSRQALISNSDTRWSCRQLHTNSIKSRMKIEIKAISSRTLARVQHAKSSPPPTRSVKSRWASRVWLVVCRMLSIRKHHNKTAVFRLTITHLIRVVPWLVSSTLQPLALIRSNQVNPTKVHSKTKMLNHHLRTSPPRNQVLLKIRRVEPVANNSKKKC